MCNSTLTYSQWPTEIQVSSETAGKVAQVLTTFLNGQLMAERHGDKNFTVVALHGWSRTRADWNAVVADFAAIAIDLPGHGASPLPLSGIGSDEMADLVIAAIEPSVAENPRKILFVGHSMGGRVAIAVAAKRPDLVSAVVLTGAPLIRPTGAGKPKFAYRVARRLHNAKLLSAKTMNTYREKYGSADYRAAQGVMRETMVRLVNENYDAHIDAVNQTKIPVHLVWGQNDTAAPLSANAVLQQRISTSTLQVLENSAHLLDNALADALRATIAPYAK